MNGRVPCFKKKGIQGGNSSKRVCRENVASTSNGSVWSKNSFDEAIIEDDFDFNNEDLQNCFLFESQFLGNDKTKIKPQTVNDKVFGKTNSFSPTGTPLKPAFIKRNSDFPDLSNLTTKKLTTYAKSSHCIQFKNNGKKTPTNIGSLISGNDSGGNISISKLNREISVLQEELSVKQGEVSNLRCELKRKDITLDTERIEGRIAIAEAECKGKEKAEKSLTEVDLQMRKLKQELERAKTDVKFKNREVEELTARQIQIRHPSNFMNSHVQPVSKDPIFSPSQKDSNFADKFDFGTRKPKVKDAEVQTTNIEKKQKKRILLKLKSPSTEFSTTREYLCMNNLSLKTKSGKPELPTEVVQTSTTFAYKSLGKLRIQCSSTGDSSSPWSREGTSVNNWYEKNSHPHFKFLSRLNTFNGVGNIDDCIEEVLKHVSPLLYKDRVINADKRTESIIALSNLLINGCNISDTVFCNVLDVTKSILNSSQSKDSLLAILSLLVAFASCKGMKCRMCLNDGSCILIKLFDRLEDINDWGHSLADVCKQFIKMTSALLRDPPLWLTNVECTCPTLLFNNVALYLHSQTKSLSEKSELWPLLISYVKVVYEWAMTNSSWWSVNELYPACRLFLNNAWEQISGPFNPMDQYSTTQLKQLILN